MSGLMRALAALGMMGRSDSSAAAQKRAEADAWYRAEQQKKQVVDAAWHGSPLGQALQTPGGMDARLSQAAAPQPPMPDNRMVQPQPQPQPDVAGAPSVKKLLLGGRTVYTDNPHQMLTYGVRG